MVSRNAFSATLPGMALLALAACDHGVNGPVPLTGSGYFVGDYAVVGNRIIMQEPPDTTWACDTGQLVKKVEPSEPDTTEYSLVGGAMTLWNEPDTIYGNGEMATAVMRTGSVFFRVGSGSGLEGRWQMDRFEFSVLQGALGTEDQKSFDRIKAMFSQRNQYMTSEIEFAGGKAWGRIAGRFAQFYVDDWNGRIAPDTAERPDSARYDIDIRLVDAGTISLMGRKSGETVTVTFTQPTGMPRYASDNPTHKAYDLGQGYIPDCSNSGIVSNWFFRFLADNRKEGILLKQGAESPENGRFREFLAGHGLFFRGIQGSPLNRP